MNVYIYVCIYLEMSSNERVCYWIYSIQLKWIEMFWLPVWLCQIFLTVSFYKSWTVPFLFSSLFLCYFISIFFFNIHYTNRHLNQSDQRENRRSLFILLLLALNREKLRYFFFNTRYVQIPTYVLYTIITMSVDKTVVEKCRNGDPAALRWHNLYEATLKAYHCRRSNHSECIHVWTDTLMDDKVKNRW